MKRSTDSMDNNANRSDTPDMKFDPLNNRNEKLSQYILNLNSSSVVEVQLRYNKKTWRVLFHEEMAGINGPVVSIASTNTDGVGEKGTVTVTVTKQEEGSADEQVCGGIPLPLPCLSAGDVHLIGISAYLGLVARDQSDVDNFSALNADFSVPEPDAKKLKTENVERLVLTIHIKSLEKDLNLPAASDLFPICTGSITFGQQNFPVSRESFALHSNYFKDEFFGKEGVEAKKELILTDVPDHNGKMLLYRMQKRSLQDLTPAECLMVLPLLHKFDVSIVLRKCLRRAVLCIALSPFYENESHVWSSTKYEQSLITLLVRMVDLCALPLYLRYLVEKIPAASFKSAFEECANSLSQASLLYIAKHYAAQTATLERDLIVARRPKVFIKCPNRWIEAQLFTDIVPNIANRFKSLFNRTWRDEDGSHMRIRTCKGSPHQHIRFELSVDWLSGLDNNGTNAILDPNSSYLAVSFVPSGRYDDSFFFLNNASVTISDDNGDLPLTYFARITECRHDEGGGIRYGVL